MNIPNQITIARFFFIPAFFFVFFSDSAYANEYAFLVLFLAGVSDVLDGYIARRSGQVTELGKLLDPLADKLMMAAVVISFTIDHRIPLIAASLFLFRESVMILFSAYYQFSKKSPIQNANWLGKLTTCLFYLSFLFLLFEWAYGQALLWVGLVASIISSIVYITVQLKN